MYRARFYLYNLIVLTINNDIKIQARQCILYNIINVCTRTYLLYCVQIVNTILTTRVKSNNNNINE